MLKKLVGALSAALIVGGGALSTAAFAAGQISGAGATFPAPVYAKWAEAYKAKTGVALNYQAIGSGGGIKQIKAKTVDFGATDKPLKPAEQEQAGLFQFPPVIGGVAPVVNLAGVGPGQLKITGPVLASIYLGDIKKWNDPQIAALNPGVNLPGTPITVVHRSDGSGTSFVFTSYLSKLSPGWAGRVGANDSVEWPAGQGGKGNDGVAAIVKQTPGSIGYVEYAFAKQNKMATLQMQNRAGRFVQPVAANFAAAAARADWAHAPGYYLLLLDQPGENAWPITAATFILVYKNQTNAATGAEVLKFFDWAYSNGNPAAEQLDYVPLPDSLKNSIRASWRREITANGKPVFGG
ncbi:phosphate ABC transporter substrate-binding protein PstS [soil metagenome]